MGLPGPLIVGVFARQMHSTSEFAMTVLFKCLTKLSDNAVCRVVCDKEVTERRRRRQRRRRRRRRRRREEEERTRRNAKRKQKPHPSPHNDVGKKGNRRRCQDEMKY